MSNLQKIILGLACMSATSAYAFTATQSSCETYINSTSNTFSLNDAANIQACLQACPTLYGSGVDGTTLQNIAQCKRNLSTLSFVSNVSMQNMQNTSNINGNTFSAPAPQVQNTVAAPVAAPTPIAPPAAPIVPQNNKSANPQIKWF